MAVASKARQDFELELLAGCKDVRRKTYSGMEHSVSPEELKDLQIFLDDILPQNTGPSPTLWVDSKFPPLFSTNCRMHLFKSSNLQPFVSLAEFSIARNPKVSWGSKFCRKWCPLNECQCAFPKSLSSKKLFFCNVRHAPWVPFEK